MHEEVIKGKAERRGLNGGITVRGVLSGGAMGGVYAREDSSMNLVEEVYGWWSMRMRSAGRVGLGFRDVAAGAAIAAVVLGVLLYAFFSFVWAPLHYIHMMFFTVLFCVVAALAISRFAFGTSPKFEPAIHIS